MGHIVGLGACAMDVVTQVERFANKDKVVGTTPQHIGGGVTANMLVQTARLGSKVSWCGALGEDEIAKELRTLFTEEHITTVAVSRGISQYTWIIVDPNGEREIYIFLNATASLSAQDIEQKFSQTIQEADHFHAEIAAIPIEAVITGVNIAKEAGAKIFLDVDVAISEVLAAHKHATEKDIEQLFQKADVVKFSEPAAKAYFGEDLEQGIKRKITNGAIIITIGEKGCLIKENDVSEIIPGFSTKVLDGTGAGDAFMGGLSVALLEGKKLTEAAVFANACGALACTKLGARAGPNRQEVEQFLQDNQ